MKMPYFLLTSVVIFLTISSFFTVAYSQENKAFEQWDLSLRFSTMGVGLETETPLNAYFKARAGVDYIGFKTGHINISLDDKTGDLQRSFGYVPDYRTKLKFTEIHGHLLADFYPVPGGVFYITGGVYVGRNKLEPDGYLSNPDNDSKAVLLPGNDWPVLDLQGRKITVTDGRIDDLELRLGGIIKPYLGIGIGNKFGSSRFGYKVELGMLYQGEYSAYQGGTKIDVEGTGVNEFQDIDKYTDWLKWWPMLGFQLTYTLF